MSDCLGSNPDSHCENPSTSEHEFTLLKNGDDDKTYIIGLLCRLNKTLAGNKCSPNVNVIVCIGDQNSSADIRHEGFQPASPSVKEAG